MNTFHIENSSINHRNNQLFNTSPNPVPHTRGAQSFSPSRLQPAKAELKPNLVHPSAKIQNMNQTFISVPHQFSNSVQPMSNFAQVIGNSMGGAFTRPASLDNQIGILPR